MLNYCSTHNCNYIEIYYREILKAGMFLLPLLGLTWIIGILAVNNETQVFAWIFAILNSLQVCILIDYQLSKHPVLFPGTVYIHFSYSQE